MPVWFGKCWDWMLQACCNERSPLIINISFRGSGKKHRNWFKATRGARERVKIQLAAALYPTWRCLYSWSWRVFLVKLWLQWKLYYVGFAVPALLSCLVNTIIKHFFFQRWNTHHVWCESLCLFWQNVGEVKANKTNKQVSQQTAPCVCVCMLS